MRLTTKVILIIVLTVTTIISVIFCVLGFRFEHQMRQNLLSNARGIYKSILTVRKWVSSYNGVYVKKEPGVPANPYLPHPNKVTVEGDTLTLQNPALVTRELSELSRMMGENFSFHMASRNFINPINKPDEFENRALIFLKKNLGGGEKKEFYQIETINKRTYFRYFAPLYTEESCLTCHAKQGYKVGDLRGGISILLSMDRYEKSKRQNLAFFGASAVISILFLTILIFASLQKSVIHPLKKIESAARRIEAGNLDFELHLKQKNEIGRLAQTFNEMRERIRSYTNQLRSSERKYRDLIEHSLEAVAIIQADGQIIDCNQKLYRLTGYQKERLEGKNFFDLIDQENKKKIHSPSSSKTESDHFETTLFTADHFQVPVEIYTIHGFTLDQQDDLSFVYVRDLTERKKIEQYSIQTEKIFALGQLSSGIAHEIRNPLFALNNNLEYLQQKFGHSPHFKEIYPELRDGVERIHRIVSAILDFARPHQPEFKPVRLEEVIQKSLTLVKKQFEKSSIAITTLFEADDRLVQADPYQLEQVFINLFLNAIQAMDGSGKLVIETKATESFYQIRVEDSGRGIPAPDLHRIFDPFYSKSPNGTGLGLAIVQRILEQHNARYEVKSQPGMGTKFTIWLPYTQE